jgi:hypothetical protein
MLWKKLPTPRYKLTGLCCVYVLFASLFCLTRTPTELKIPYGTHHITVKKQNNKITIIDPGFPRRALSINTWINYTFLPELAKNFGVQTVYKLIIEKQNPSAVHCAKLLQQKGYTREIVYKKLF